MLAALWYLLFSSFKEEDLRLLVSPFPQKEFDGNSQEEFMKPETGAVMVLFFLSVSYAIDFVTQSS